jgi:hypothetical protein
MQIDGINIDALTAAFGDQSSLGQWIATHGGIKKLIAKAIKEDWLSKPQGQANFIREFQKTEWFQKYASSARGYLIAEAQGGPDFAAKRETAKEIIKARAVAMGAELDDAALEQFTTAYYMNGWGEKGREGLLDKALAGELPDFQTNHLNFQKGGPQAIIMNLKSLAEANGLSFTDDFYQSAAKSVLIGASTLEDKAAELRRMSASAMPWWKDQIEAGANARDLASAHISVYARMRGIDPKSVKLNDPNLKIAFNGKDAKGNNAPMGLWDYEKALRQTDWYEYTQDAHQRIGSIVGELGAMMGFGGSR